MDLVLGSSLVSGMLRRVHGQRHSRQLRASGFGGLEFRGLRLEFGLRGLEFGCVLGFQDWGLGSGGSWLMFRVGIYGGGGGGYRSAF